MTEHGWNDPPTFSFSVLQSGASRKPQMTKRVNHAIVSDHSLSAVQTAQKKDTSIPPTPLLFNSEVNSSAPPPPSVKEDTRTTTEEHVGESRVSKDSELTNEGELGESRTFDQVLAVLTELTEKLCDSLQKRILDEIKRRLGILSKHWEEGRLSRPVQVEMTKLASALERGDSQTADGIHVALMVDHTSEVSQWMVGVKRLVAATKQHHSQT